MAEQRMKIDDEMISVSSHSDYKMKQITVEMTFPSHPGIIMLLIKHFDAMGEQIAQASLADTKLDKEKYDNMIDLLEAMAKQPGGMLPGERWVELCRNMSTLCCQLNELADDEIKEFLGPDLEALFRKMGVTDTE